MSRLQLEQCVCYASGLSARSWTHMQPLTAQLSLVQFGTCMESVCEPTFLDRACPRGVWHVRCRRRTSSA